jgi:hypothetical protein
MPARPTRSVLGLAAALAVAASGATAGQQFRSGVEVVRLPVVVTDRDGGIVRGLTREDFIVLEDGKPQEVAYFVEGAPGRDLSPEQIEELGLALMMLEAKLQELKTQFGLADEDLNLDLGPIGRLI